MRAASASASLSGHSGSEILTEVDNFRLFHTPGIFYSLPFKIRSIPKTPKGQSKTARAARPSMGADTAELKDETLHIRISGVDAPELAHFGNPAQPHGQESLDWLKTTILGKRMRCQLLRKDQYNRIVRSNLETP